MPAAAASPPRTCDVLQAAYTAATRHGTLAYPSAVRPGARALELRRFVPSYRAQLPLSAREFDALAARDRPRPGAFRPACRWKGRPGPPGVAVGGGAYVTFTDPVFSADGRLAITEVSFRGEGRFGYGEVCVMRRRNRWTGSCRNSWIS